MRWQPRSARSAARTAKRYDPPILRELVQAGVFGAGLLQDGNIRIGILPERQEILISHTAGGEVPGEGVRPREAQHRQCPVGAAHREPTVIENFLEFCLRRFAVASAQVGLPAQVGSEKASGAFALAEVKGLRGLKKAKGLAGVPAA